jgi:hypothetical protein
MFFLFKAMVSEPYSAETTLYIETEKGEFATGSIYLSAIGCSRTFRTSINHLRIAPLSTGVKVEETVEVFNLTFSDTNLPTELPVLDKTLPFALSFPRGNSVNHRFASLSPLITFCSTKAISFAALAG